MCPATHFSAYVTGDDMCEILCTAIKKDGKVYTDSFGMVPHFKIEVRHNIIESVSGFLTTDRDFVDRHEVMDIAFAAKQIDGLFYSRSFGLSSEDF